MMFHSNRKMIDIYDVKTMLLSYTDTTQNMNAVCFLMRRIRVALCKFLRICFYVMMIIEEIGNSNIAKTKLNHLVNASFEKSYF